MIHLVSFATGNCVSGQQKLVKSAIEHGIKPENIHSFSKTNFDKASFVKENTHIFKEKRGIGYWSWKPFFILEVMKRINWNDVVIYHDSGRPCYDWKFTEPIEPFVNHVVDKYDGVGVVFGPFKHGVWTKYDCLEVMKCNKDIYKKHNQASATWSIWEKNVLSISILNEWKRWLVHPSRIVSDDKSILGSEDSKFKNHRHDQSILTNILLKLHFNGKLKTMKTYGVYEKNFSKVGKRILEREQN